VIPAVLSRALKIESGNWLVTRMVEESLVAVKRRLRERFKHIPRDVRLVDELISERRAAGAEEPGGA